MGVLCWAIVGLGILRDFRYFCANIHFAESMKTFPIIMTTALLCAALVSCKRDCNPFDYSRTQEIYKAGDAGVFSYRIPALVYTQKGTLLAFAEARIASRKDVGDIDLVLRRSEDGGQTWSDVITVMDRGADHVGNPCPVVLESGRVLLVSQGTDIGSSPKVRHLFIQYSDDDGLTWSEPREVEHNLWEPEWTHGAVGPGHAIQLKHGEHKGRIVVPSYYKIKSPEGVSGASYMIWSDDEGATWHRSADFIENGNESTAAEFSNGDIYINSREVLDYEGTEKIRCKRIFSWSRDGGETLEAGQYDENLTEPACEGSVLRYSPRGRKADWLLYSGPDSFTGRYNLKVKLSRDLGASWKTVYQEPWVLGGYSDMAVMKDGSVAILYESGMVDYREAITFDIIPADVIKGR